MASRGNTVDLYLIRMFVGIKKDSTDSSLVNAKN